MKRSIAAAIASLGALAVFASGCPHVGVERSVDVDFLWVKTQGGKPTDEGGLTRARVTLAPNPGGDVRVGVFEESPGSIGEMWRAAVWLSAVMSAMQTGQDLASARLTVEANGFIDGPSAGSLMTAAMMAARLGGEIRPDVTITGTVNPDGSIGPVGGLPQKVAAAARAGKKRIGYPAGQGIARDAVTGQPVNLVQLARRYGAEAVGVQDVDAAYALLSGHTLERPKALSLKAMQLPQELRQRLRVRAKAWLALAERNIKGIGAVSDLSRPLQERWQEAGQRARESQRYLDRGEGAAAYWHATSAAVTTETARTLSELERLARSGKAPAVLQAVRALRQNVDQRFRALTARFRRRYPETVGPTVQYLDAMEAVISSATLMATATSNLNASLSRAQGLLHGGGALPDRVRAAMAELTPRVTAFVLADINLNLAADTLAIPAETPNSEDVTSLERQRLTDLFTRAAQANLHYFDATHIDLVARARHVSRDVVVTEFANSERAYVAAHAHLKMQSLHVFGHDTPGRKLADLTGALSSYFNSSSLIARYESLQVERDAAGKPARVGRERVFWRMLALAERKAREHAARAERRLGAVPVPALIAYHIGRVYQERPGLTDKLIALEQFWRASMWSQLSAHLARP